MSKAHSLGLPSRTPSADFLGMCIDVAIAKELAEIAVEGAANFGSLWVMAVVVVVVVAASLE